MYSETLYQLEETQLSIVLESTDIQEFMLDISFCRKTLSTILTEPQIHEHRYIESFSFFRILQHRQMFGFPFWSLYMHLRPHTILYPCVHQPPLSPHQVSRLLGWRVGGELPVCHWVPAPRLCTLSAPGPPQPASHISSGNDSGWPGIGSVQECSRFQMVCVCMVVSSIWHCFCSSADDDEMPADFSVAGSLPGDAQSQSVFTLSVSIPCMCHKQRLSHIPGLQVSHSIMTAHRHTVNRNSRLTTYHPDQLEFSGDSPPSPTYPWTLHSAQLALSLKVS